MSLPDVRVGRRAPGKVRANVLVLPVRAVTETGESAGAATWGLGTEHFDAVADAGARYVLRQHATGSAGDLHAVPLAPTRDGAPDELIVVGVGGMSPDELRTAGAAVGRRLRARSEAAVVWPDDAHPTEATVFVESLLLASYRPPRTGIRPPDDRLRRVHLLGPWAAEVTTTTVPVARAVVRARDWANAPADRIGPASLARQAVKQARQVGLTATVRDEQWLRRRGFGGLLAVGAGSARPPCLVELRHEPPGGRATDCHVVLVGKGVTFDSGGLSLKPADAMKLMKTDMAGAAAVLATMLAVAELALPVRVSALLPLAENLPSGSAYRPSDVLTTYDRSTVEVVNTDAEGRLLLADALGYAVTQLVPTVVVDVATLTGAASLGLGRRHAAVFSPDDALADALVAAGTVSGDQAWRLPLVEDYRQYLASDIADLCHVTKDPVVGGGAITAALFLQHFVGDVPWAHLDIAGPARADRDEREAPRGATGYGPRLLLQWLANGAPC